MNGNKIFATASLVTFGLFMVESLLHYNVGRKAGMTDPPKGIIIPPTKQFIQMGAITAVVAVLNGMIIKSIVKS